MKKIGTLAVLLTSAMAVQAQSPYAPLNDQPTFQELMRSAVILVLIYLLTNFILTLVKTYLDDRLKKQIVATGTPDTVAAQLLPADKNHRAHALKGFCLLTTAAIGLALIGLYQCSGIYSVSVMALSLAFGYLGYYFLSRRLRD